MDINHLMFAAAVMLAATALAVGLAKKLELGSIVALLIVGVVLGPHSPRPLLTGHVDELQAIGEIGVMLLLFAIGLDVQPSRLWSMRGLVFGLGTAQYVLTTAAFLAFFAAIFGVAGIHWESALVVSLALTTSSAAVPFSILQERGETATAQGRAVVAVDIYQGFVVVAILALIPLLGAGAVHDGQAIEIEKILEVGAAIVGVFVLGRYVLPAALTLTAPRLGPSSFVVIVIAGVFFAGWWMESVGASMALGAFMMGVLLSTTTFSDQIKASVAPAKRLLLAIFFIAIGMAIDLKQVLDLKAELLLYLPCLLLIKFVVLLGLARLFRFGMRSAVLTALLLMPFDEIGYVILASANANGLLSPRDYAVGITVISFSFIVSSLLINLGYKLTDRITGPDASREKLPTIADNTVIVAGYGHVGHAICAMLERARVPYTAFELDAESLARANTTRHNVHYGDLTNTELMEATGILRARLVIIATRTYPAAKQIFGNLRQFYPHVPVMAAVPFLFQRDELQRMGAKNVDALLPEGTLSFGRAVLDRLGITVSEAEGIISSLKSRDYAALRGVGDVEPQTMAISAE